MPVKFLGQAHVAKLVETGKQRPPFKHGFGKQRLVIEAAAVTVIADGLVRLGLTKI